MFKVSLMDSLLIPSSMALKPPWQTKNLEFIGAIKISF
jgi:hypothetical protein